MVDRSKLLDTIKNGAYWGAGVTFQRSNAVPLEKYSIFGSIEDAQKYASENPVAYPGQIISVVSSGGESSSYIIMGDGSLKTVGLTDDTLTKNGYAADAKITGDKITAIEAFIPIILTQEEYDALVDSGTIDEQRIYMIKQISDETVNSTEEVV